MYSFCFFSRRVSYLQGLGFADISRKPIAFPDLDQRPADLTYFIFHSVVSAVATNKRAPDKSSSLEFSLRFPQTLTHYAPSFGRSSVTTVTTSPMIIQSQPLSDCSTKLGDFSDVSFDKRGVTELRALFADTRTAISLPAVTPISKGVKFPSFPPL